MIRFLYYRKQNIYYHFTVLHLEFKNCFTVVVSVSRPILLFRKLRPKTAGAGWLLVLNPFILCVSSLPCEKIQCDLDSLCIPV